MEAATIGVLENEFAAIMDAKGSMTIDELASIVNQVAETLDVGDLVVRVRTGAVTLERDNQIRELQDVIDTFSGEIGEGDVLRLETTWKKTYGLFGGAASCKGSEQAMSQLKGVVMDSLKTLLVENLKVENPPPPTDVGKLGITMAEESPVQAGRG